ncbi:MAG: FtsX-like permease family protein [Pseudomonadota bacterium]
MNWRMLVNGGDAPPIVPATGWSAPLTTLAAMAMAFLAVLTLAAGIAAGRLAATWEADLANIATVSITVLPEQMADRLERTLEVLRTTPDIQSVRVLSDAEHAELLRPWLGANASIEGLPAPKLIELQLTNGGPDAARLQTRLDQSAPGARFDDHQAWRGPLARAAGSLKTLSWAATLLVIAAAAAMIGLAAQATLAGNTEVVRVIRLIGAEESFITRAFVARIALRGLIGGAAGTVLGLIALALLPDLGGAAEIGMQLTPGLSTSLFLLIAVPVATMGIALVTSHLAIRAELRRIL